MKKLSQDTINEIQSLYKKCLNGYEVARRLGVSKSVVYKYIEKPGLPRPRWTEREKSRLTELYAQKIPIKNIAKRLNKSQTAIKLQMCRHRKKVKNDPDIKLAAHLLDVAFKAGLSPGRAIQKIRTSDAFARGRISNDI